MITKKDYLNALQIVKAYKLQLEAELSDINSVLEDILDLKLSDCNLSNRAKFFLIKWLETKVDVNINQHNLREYTLRYFITVRKRELFMLRNCGAKTVKEILDFFLSINIKII